MTMEDIIVYPQELKDFVTEYQNKHVANIAKYKPPMYWQLVECTGFLPPTATLRERMYHVAHDTSSPPSCIQCGAPVKWHTSRGGYVEFCGPKCASNSDTVKEKRQQTCLDTYGVSSYSQTEQHRTAMAAVGDDVLRAAAVARRETLLSKYGVEHPVHVPGASDKRKATNLERYGHTNILAADVSVQTKIDRYGTAAYTKTDEFREKRKVTMLERYGTEYNDGKTFENKRKSTCADRYGVSSWTQAHITTDTLHNLQTRSCLYTAHIENKVPASTIARDLGVDKQTVLKYLRLHGIEITRHCKSWAEREIAEFLRSNGIEYTSGDRKVLGGKELDFVLPTHKVAIEYCGLYRHSTAHERNTRSYHKQKMDRCSEAGLRLVTIFEDEWVHNRTLVEGKILAMLGMDTRERVFARKCEVQVVDSVTKNAFFDTHHIQGAGPGSVSLALVHDGEYVAMMSFVKQQGGKFILNRYATSIHVVGGFSKLLHAFMRSNDWEMITSFADRRWSLGKVYEQNGFVLDEILPPDYDYVDLVNVKRVHKFNFRHKNLPAILGDQYDPQLSETKNTQQAGWYRIYNCGLIRYVLVKND